MDFTPHPKLKNNIVPESSNGDAFVTEKNEWKDSHHPFSILLMPRSLLIFNDDAYSGKCLYIDVLVVSLVYNHN